MAHPGPTWRDRQRAERQFYDNRAAQEADRDLHVADDLHHSTQGISLSVLRARCHLGPSEGMRVLDCGCGTGMAAVLWARSGARVWGFDISPQRVSLAKKRAVVNGVANQVSLQVGAFEELCYQAESFDLLFGIHVLHHVDVAKAAREAHRVLKPGGKAVFWEPMDRNPVLRFFRRYAGRFGIVKLGSQHEHPLTSRDLEDLSAAFGGRARVHNTGFYFFSLLDRNVVRYRSRALSRLLRGLDLGAARLLPPLRRYSFVGLVELTK